jgi:hypothetical protein
MGIAASLVQGRISALVFVDRVKPHPVGAKLLNLGPAKDLLEGSKFDPLRDVTKAVVVSNNAREERAIVFAEHSVDAKLIPALVAELAGKSEPPGEVLEAAPNWTVKVAKKGRAGVVCLVAGLWPSEMWPASGVRAQLKRQATVSVDGWFVTRSGPRAAVFLTWRRPPLQRGPR